VRGIWLIAVALAFSGPAWSHDFWLQPTRFKVAASAPDEMTIQSDMASFARGVGQSRTRRSVRQPSGPTDRLIEDRRSSPDRQRERPS